MSAAAAPSPSRSNTYQLSTPRLPAYRRYLLLALLSAVTAIVVALGAEFAARAIWQKDSDEACLVHEADGSAHFRPNCVAPMKIPEGEWTTDRYNECGYRTNAHCGPKPAGTIRIDLLGASYVHGRGVAYEQTFPTEIGNALQSDLRHPVEIENLSVFRQRPIDSYRRTQEALALHPDVLVMIVTPHDVSFAVSAEEMAGRKTPLSMAPRASAPQLNWLHRMHDWLLQDSRALMVLQSYLLYDPATFQRVHMASATNRGELADLRSPLWQRRFADLQTLLGEMSEETRKAGVPLVLVAIPTRIEATLMQSSQPVAGIDPYAFSKGLKSICENTHITFVDLFQGFKSTPNADRMFFVVDGHLTPEGHAVVARELAPTLEDIAARKLDARAATQNNDGAQAN